MKNVKKARIALAVGLIAVFALAMVGCGGTWEGNASSSSSAGAKTVTVKLSSSKYTITYDGKDYTGSCKKTSVNVLSVDYDHYEFTSGGEGYAEVLEKELYWLDYENDDVFIRAYNLSKKSVVDEYDIELIIEDDEE